MGSFVSHAAKALLVIVLLAQAGSVRPVTAADGPASRSGSASAPATPHRGTPPDVGSTAGVLRAAPPAGGHPDDELPGRWDAEALPGAEPESRARLRANSAMHALPGSEPVSTVRPEDEPDRTAPAAAHPAAAGMSAGGAIATGPLAGGVASSGLSGAGRATVGLPAGDPAAPGLNVAGPVPPGQSFTGTVAAGQPHASAGAAGVPDAGTAIARLPEADPAAVRLSDAEPAVPDLPGTPSGTSQPHASSATAGSARAASSSPPHAVPGAAAVLAAPMYRVPTTGKEIVLTIDDGPSALTADFLAVLAAEEVPAAFFWLTGSSHLPLAAEVVARGHQLGTHTITHPRLPGLDPAEVAAQIAGSKAALESAAGVPVRYFRPPYGEHDRHVLETAAAQGLATVLWSVDSRDWALADNPEQIIHNVMAQVRPGAVILIHERRQTLEVLPELIRRLREAGYTFVPLPPVPDRAVVSHEAG